MPNMDYMDKEMIGELILLNLRSISIAAVLSSVLHIF